MFAPAHPLPPVPWAVLSAHVQPIATRAPWVVATGVVLVVPGTLLSIAFTAIGAVMLAALAADYFARGGGAHGSRRRLPVATQLGLGVGGMAIVGGCIALGAWIM